MTLDEIKEVASRIKYLDWKLVVKESGERPYLQWHFRAANTDPGSSNELIEQRSGKCWLSYFMIPQEIERNAYLALVRAVEHELNENYYYRGYQIHNPHVDPDALVEMMQRNPIVAREEHVGVPS
jgi:hypothetical protein